jgi:hypothetical protein
MGDNNSLSRGANSQQSQMNISVLPQYEMMNVTSINYQNLQKAAAIAVDSQHTLSNFMDQSTISYVQTQLTAHSSTVSINDGVQKVLAEMIRLTSADCLTTASDGLSQAGEIYYCVAYAPKGQIPITNLTDDTVYRSYHVKVNSLKERHMGVSEENRKEMISALIKNLGKHPSRDIIQYQIKMLQSRVKTMPESGRRDFDGYLTQIAKARVELIQSVAVCNQMHMLKRECTVVVERQHDNGLSGTKRSYEELDEGERDNERDREHDKNRNRENLMTKCNHCNKVHPPPCRLLSHPDCNPDASIPFHESDKGKQWLQKGHHVVSSQLTLDGTVWNNPNPKPQFNSRQQSHHNNNRPHNNYRGSYDNRHHNNRRGRF